MLLSVKIEQVVGWWYVKKMAVRVIVWVQLSLMVTSGPILKNVCSSECVFVWSQSNSSFQLLG